MCFPDASQLQCTATFEGSLSSSSSCIESPRLMCLLVRRDRLAAPPCTRRTTVFTASVYVTRPFPGVAADATPLLERRLPRPAPVRSRLVVLVQRPVRSRVHELDAPIRVAAGRQLLRGAAQRQLPVP